MKNNFISFFIIFSFFLVNINNSFSEEFNFEAAEIEILDEGQKLKAIDGVKIISNNGVEIIADEFTYDKKTLILTATGNIKILDTINKIKTEADKIFYFKNKEIISTDGKAIIYVDNDYIINSKNIEINRNTKEVTSSEITKVKDVLNNLLFLDSFNYSLIDKIIRAKNIKFLNTQKDNIFLNDGMINLNTDEIIGKDPKVYFNNATFGNSKNQPRLKGNTFYSNKNTSEIKKGNFTTCKKRDKCPPWVMSAEKITHDKRKKRIYYKNAWLKVYDMPLLYFPKFFHPDPTVKRQSGFLIPKFTDSNTLGASLDLPYYKVISDNKDLTFTPRLYSNQDFILQTEYREVNENSSHITDLSWNKGQKLSSTDKDNTRAHFFSNSNFNLGLSGFDESKIEINLQRTTNDQYLKVYKLKSPLMDSTSSMSSFLNFEANKSDLSLTTSVEVYEDLTKSQSDRYEYVFPNFNIVKEINLKDSYNGNLSLESTGFQKLHDTNVYNASLINELLFKSDPIFSINGLKSNYIVSLKNVNLDSENSTINKNKQETELLASTVFETSYPLKKEGYTYNDFLTPKVSLMFSPNKTKNMLDEDRRIDINNIFSFDRIGRDDAVEGGQSLTIGTEYKKTNKTNNRDLFSLNLGTVFRDEHNHDLPKKSTIGNKASDIVGNLTFDPNNNFNVNYNFSFDNNLGTSNYNEVKTTLSVNNFVTTFEYLEENNIIGSESYLGNETSLNFSDNKSLSFSTRKNRKTDLTEFYNLIYEYKNDCLIAAIEYNKEYYTDTDLQPEEQLFFSLTIVPLGKTNSPNINK